MGKYLLELYLILLLHLEIGAHKHKVMNSATLSLPVLGSLIQHLFCLHSYNSVSHLELFGFMYRMIMRLRSGQYRFIWVNTILVY